MRFTVRICLKRNCYGNVCRCSSVYYIDNFVTKFQKNVFFIWLKVSINVVKSTLRKLSTWVEVKFCFYRLWLATSCRLQLNIKLKSLMSAATGNFSTNYRQKVVTFSKITHHRQEFWKRHLALVTFPNIGHYLIQLIVFNVFSSV